MSSSSFNRSSPGSQLSSLTFKMPTLESLFKTKKDGPVNVKICGVAGEKTYVNANGEEKKFAVLGVADSSMIAKCTLYDTSKLKVLQEGNSVMLLNVIVKDNNSLTLTTKSRISKVGDVKVSSERQKAAREIAFPPMSSEVPLKDIEKSPIKSMLSVRGQIVTGRNYKNCLCEREGYKGEKCNHQG